VPPNLVVPAKVPAVMAHLDAKFVSTHECFISTDFAHFFLAAPLNLANSPSLHLLTPEEQTLCSQLRILPKPYLVIKETLVREYARRGGKLRRREARDLVKIDVNKTSRVWDFLVQAGFMRVGNTDPIIAVNATQDTS
jgi:transcriptional adapter 2-alpha